MSIGALKALRDRLVADTALTDFWLAHYDSPCKHLIGYKRAASAKDFPSVCYVPSKGVRQKFKPEGSVRVSLIIGVHESGISDDVFDGVQRLDEVVELISAALMPLNLSDIYVLNRDDIDVVYDLGMRHPFHELEMQLGVEWCLLAPTEPRSTKLTFTDAPHSVVVP